MTMPRLTLALSFALLLALPGRAEAPAANIGLEIQVIAANAQKDPPDPKLKAIQKRLDALFPSFPSQKLVAEQNFLLGLQSPGVMSLPGGRTLELKPREFEASGKLSLHLN